MTSRGFRRRTPQQAGFGDVEVYPVVYDKAAALVDREAWNQPLPDRN